MISVSPLICYKLFIDLKKLKLTVKNLKQTTKESTTKKDNDGKFIKAPVIIIA